MKKVIIASILVSFALTFFASIWAIRKVYVEYFTDSAAIRVINYSDQSVSIALTFPSKEKEELKLDSRAFRDVQVSHTGEGSISVVVNEREPILTGYVTTVNNPILLLIGDDLSVEFDYIKKQIQTR